MVEADKKEEMGGSPTFFMTLGLSQNNMDYWM
jgi:hypothetical protein